MNPHETSPAHDAPDTKPHAIKRALLPFLIVTAIVLGKLIGNNEVHEALTIFGLKLDFLVFGGTLLAIAIKDRLRLEPRDIAVSGLGLVIAHNLYMGTDLVGHMTHDNFHTTKELINLFLILLGFALLAIRFDTTRLGEWMPALLPDDWKGPAVLLCLVTVVSAFLDNIASALIGYVIAQKVFNGRVSVGYIAALVACSNAGGAPSVVGDTTTTMMWIAGASPLDVSHASVGALGAVLVVIPLAARQQDKYQRIQKDPDTGITLKDVQWKYLISVLWALAGCVVANMTYGLPGIGVWIGLIIGWFLVGIDKIDKDVGLHALRDAVFLVALVTMAGLMPVKELPAASAQLAAALGFLSAIFDNIPLTKLCLDQGGYDWGFLAYAVGYGGSMIWFGSSAGVAVCSKNPEAKSVYQWVKQGWFVPLGYVVGLALMYATLGWHPHELKRPASADHGAAAVTSGEPAQVVSDTLDPPE